MRAWVIALAIALLLLAAGSLALCHYGPEQNEQKAQAVILFLQFVAALVLIVITAHYANAAWSLVESQNRAPEISVSDKPIVPSAPKSQGDEFSALFPVLIANPSIRATSVRLERVEINGVIARHATFGSDPNGNQKAVTVNAGGLAEMTVTANFTDISAFPAMELKILFIDVFRRKSC